jgi:hypothetical protein
MAVEVVRFDMSFADFRFLQRHMGQRLFRRNKGTYALALVGVVLCAFFIALAVVVNLHPVLAAGLLGLGYALSFYAAIILCLVAAILSLIPAVRLRLGMLRLQVSDRSPLLGPTRVTLEEDGIVLDRTAMRTKYMWAAIQGVEVTGRAVILPVDSGIGVIVPAAAFPTEAARYEFAAELHKRLDAARANGAGAPRSQ